MAKKAKKAAPRKPAAPVELTLHCANCGLRYNEAKKVTCRLAPKGPLGSNVETRAFIGCVLDAKK